MKNINKILLSIIVVTALWGCDLEKYPKHQISIDESVKTINDVERLRLGSYSYARSFFGSMPWIAYDLMGDFMHSVTGASNTYGNFPRWTFTTADGDIGGVWNGAYAAIANINLFLDNIDDVETVSKEEEDLVTKTKGEVTLLRAMIEHQLLLKYCKSYAQVSDPRAELGIPSMRTYNPGIEPSRNSLFDSYDLLLKDIELAKTALAEVVFDKNDPNKVPEGDLHIDCVYALEAQVRLAMGDWPGSAAAASKVITSSAMFGLIGNATGFEAMWSGDKGDEIIFNFYATNAEGSATWGNYFRTEDPQQSGAYYTADFIPAQGLIDLYDEYPGDIRKNAYFMQGVLGKDGPAGVWFLNKYPGNRALREDATKNDYRHKRIVFRLADMYLTAAEAYAMAGDATNANKMLGDLRSKRIPGYSHTNLSGTDLMEAIKTERLKEMVMEGTRISDLKRWNDPMTRLSEQSAPGEITIIETRNVTISAGYYKFVWPIPIGEMSANDGIKDQQNEGWL